MSTSVPEPSFGPNGFTVPSEADILAGVTTDIDAALGGGVNPGLTTPQGQIAMTETAIIGDKNAQFLWFVNNVDPAFASGRMQDAIGRIYFLARIPGAPTVQPCTCSGLTGVTIPVGALARDQDNNLWVSQQSGVIPGSGQIVLNFAATVNGPSPGPVSLTIYQSVFGWDSVTPTGDAALGTDVESHAAFETRRALSTAMNSAGQLPAVLGAVLAVPNVLDAYVTENDTGSPVTIGGVSINANSLYVCVLGGLAADIGFAIWTKKAPGCGYTGNTTVTVTDPSPQYQPPVPTYTVTFQIPSIIDFAVLVVLKNNAGIPSNALTLIQNTIIAAFAGTDGGSRATIGSTVFASRYYGPVALLGSWAQIIDIQVGISGAAASFTASISGTTMTVSAVASGVLAVGQFIQSVHTATGTTITALGSGSGGTGTYTISTSQTVSSESMTATTLVNDLTLNIDQAPSVAAANIGLQLV